VGKPDRANGDGGLAPAARDCKVAPTEVKMILQKLVRFATCSVLRGGVELSEWAGTSVVRSGNLDDVSEDGEASGVGMTVKSWSICRCGRRFHRGELEIEKLSLVCQLILEKCATVSGSAREWVTFQIKEENLNWHPLSRH
jgi:hypothetical protein